MPAASASRDTIGTTLATATARLERAGVGDARANAEMLLAHLLDTDRGGLFVHRDEPLSDAIRDRFLALVARRATREPLQHVIGTQAFYGREFVSDGRALVPRPETEGLVHALLSLGLPAGARVVDLGTGSGCIAVTVALERPDLEVDALEISPEALGLARENARRLGARKVRFTEGDQTAPPRAWIGAMHAVVCNPPYVRDDEWPGLEPEVREHDPRRAVVAGETGLEAYRGLAPAAFGLLRPAGRLVLELGWTQARDVRSIVESAGFAAVEVRPDLAGIDRVLLARKPEQA